MKWAEKSESRKWHKENMVLAQNQKVWLRSEASKEEINPRFISGKMYQVALTGRYLTTWGEKYLWCVTKKTQTKSFWDLKAKLPISWLQSESQPWSTNFPYRIPTQKKNMAGKAMLIMRKTSYPSFSLKPEQKNKALNP